jgi:hypothetical protein
MSADERAMFSTYTKALRDAGVMEADLRLLRELAEMNAEELSARDEHVRASRVIL